MAFNARLSTLSQIENKIWACGGMVDTLVLGTSAKAWEFESLHAQIKNHFGGSFFIATLTVVFVVEQKQRRSTHSSILPRTARGTRLR